MGKERDRLIHELGGPPPHDDDQEEWEEAVKAFYDQLTKGKLPDLLNMPLEPRYPEIPPDDTPPKKP